MATPDMQPEEPSSQRVSQLHRLDQVCDRFEQGWKAGDDLKFGIGLEVENRGRITDHGTYTLGGVRPRGIDSGGATGPRLFHSAPQN